jgi:hypothetical protein
LIQGFLSLAGKGVLAGSSLSGPDGHKKAEALAVSS